MLIEFVMDVLPDTMQHSPFYPQQDINGVAYWHSSNSLDIYQILHHFCIALPCPTLKGNLINMPQFYIDL